MKDNKIIFGDPVQGYIVASSDLGSPIDLDKATLRWNKRCTNPNSVQL